MALMSCGSFRSGTSYRARARGDLKRGERAVTYRVQFICRTRHRAARSVRNPRACTRACTVRAGARRVLTTTHLHGVVRRPLALPRPCTLKTQLAESSKDWTWTSTRSLTPVGQLESCSKHLRVLRERSHCQSGSTKRIPKRVRVRLSRTSRTDEAAERCRLHERGPLSLEAARDGAFSDVFFCSREREFATNTCPKRRFCLCVRRSGFLGVEMKTLPVHVLCLV